MPPRNATRSVLTEASLAARVAYEREKRGWTYDGLAKRMTDVGCSINQSALYKIEKGEPRRRITVDELVAFSVVFEVGVDHLLLPPELAHSVQVGELLIAWSEARYAASQADDVLKEAWAALHRHVVDHPEIADKVEEIVGIWAESHFGEDHRDEATAYWMSKLTEGDRERHAAYLERVLAYV